MTKLLLATSNQGKVREYRSLFQALPYHLVTMVEQRISTMVSEKGESMEENARIKATALASEAQLLALADDSGLEVNVLGGEPGVFSARYAGEGATDEDRIHYLLSRLKNITWQQRSACFRCVIAIATPRGDFELCSGECSGVITFKPQGENGFGYDPVFFIPELEKTMAELPLELKNKISHRAKAAGKVLRALERLTGSQHVR